ncbi:MAG: hypothetical protein P8N76_08240 [Pirellulaceae bacterium]|nr:hypothetical protein [Pirellulaceae bacterium]
MPHSNPLTGLAVPNIIAALICGSLAISVDVPWQFKRMSKSRRL